MQGVIRLLSAIYKEKLTLCSYIRQEPPGLSCIDSFELVQVNCQGLPWGLE
jgi:hypothetical protein